MRHDQTAIVLAVTVTGLICGGCASQPPNGSIAEGSDAQPSGMMVINAPESDAIIVGAGDPLGCAFFDQYVVAAKAEWRQRNLLASGHSVNHRAD